MPLDYDLDSLQLGGGLSFPDWISLLTLCLAPVIAHIVSGAPQPSYLHHKRPKWHERICHYNPTSIMWRYFAITDRRLRTRTWNSVDIAASNALFWTTSGWDGTEKLIIRSLPYCAYLPEYARAEIFSEETVKTVVTALQGVQAAYVFINSYVEPTDSFAYLGADQIFYPLAVLGLFRLCAAPWISNNFKYTSRVNVDMSPTASDVEDEHMLPLDDLVQLPELAFITPIRRHRVSCWSSRLFRTFYSTILVGIWSLTIIWIFPIPYYSGIFSRHFTATSLIAALFYFGFTTASVALHIYYFLTNQTVSTIIPCAARLWYKVYTITLFASMTILLVVSLLETKKTVCGIYTSLPLDVADYLCPIHGGEVLKLSPDLIESEIFGLALKHPYIAKDAILKGGEFWVRNFSGTCLGRWSSKLRAQASTLDVVDFTDLIEWGNGTVTPGV